MIYRSMHKVDIALVKYVVRIWLQLTFSRQISVSYQTSSMICSTNQRTGFYMLGAFVMKELITTKYIEVVSLFNIIVLCQS